MGCRHVYGMKGMIYAFFGSASVVFDCAWLRNFFENGDGFFFVVATRLSFAKQGVPSPLKNLYVGFWSLK